MKTERTSEIIQVAPTIDSGDRGIRFLRQCARCSTKFTVDLVAPPIGIPTVCYFYCPFCGKQSEFKTTVRAERWGR